jgi:hypothetical protein
MVSRSYLLLDVENAARVLEVTPRRVRALCKTNRIPGARTFGRSWQVPARVREGGRLEIKVTPGTRGPKMGR